MKNQEQKEEEQKKKKSDREDNITMISHTIQIKTPSKIRYSQQYKEQRNLH